MLSWWPAEVLLQAWTLPTPLYPRSLLVVQPAYLSLQSQPVICVLPGFGERAGQHPQLPASAEAP